MLLSFLPSHPKTLTPPLKNSVVGLSSQIPPLMIPPFTNRPTPQMDQRDVDCAIDVVHQAALAGIDFTDEDWHDHPMFRWDLPPNVETDRHFSCFQHLLYEGQTHDSLALQFKELGNELYQAGRAQWQLAAYWWTRALDERPSDLKLRSILYANRATVSLGFQQYQRAAIDSDWAIRFDPTNKKAYVRAAHAYQGMFRWDKALSIAKAGLEVIPESDPLRSQLTKVIATVGAEVASIDRRVAAYFGALTSCNPYFQRRRLAVGEFAHSWMGNWELSLGFNEDSNEAIWPVVVVYDEVLQVDFVQGFGERAPLKELVKMVIPGEGAEAPPWDSDGRYQISTIQVYVGECAVQPKWGRLEVGGEAENVEVDPDCSLLDVFKQPRYVVPGFPVIGIVVRRSRFAKGLGIQEKITKSGRVPVGGRVVRVDE